MTLKASFVFKNPDSTRDLNARLRRVISRGIVWGGNLTPGVGLTVQVNPLVAVGFDGMTVESDAVQTLVVVGGGVKQYCVIHARYNEGGAPATPTLTWRVLTQAAYLADPEKDYLIVIGTVTPTGVVVLPGEIDFTERDEVNPLGRDWYRGVVANPAALPPPPSPVNPATNRVGDFFFVQSEHTFYFWNGTIWEGLNTGSYNSETTLMNQQVVQQQRDRARNGSGVLAGARGMSDPDGIYDAFANEGVVTILSGGFAANILPLDSFSALVHGHYCEVRAQEITLPPPPAVPGSRLDLVFLEVWREAILVPESQQYTHNTTPGGGGAGTYTLDQVDSRLQTSQWNFGMGLAGINSDINAVEGDSHDWTVVKYRMVVTPNVPTAVLYNNTTGAALSTNLDGNPFTIAINSAERDWQATSITASDGVTWAIPLFVVRRYFGDTFIQEYDASFNRRVMPVYPVADLDQAAKSSLDSDLRREAIATQYYESSAPYQKPSGFVTGMDLVVQTTTPTDPVNTIRFLPVDRLMGTIRIRGLEDVLAYFGGAGGNDNVYLGVPPAVGWERVLVYIKMNITLFHDNTAKAHHSVSRRHRPWLPSTDAGPGLQIGTGWKRGFVSYTMMVHNFGATDVRDEVDSMTAAGWSKGDVSMGFAMARYADGGVWSRAIAIDADDRVHPLEAEWAIPVCLVHRRNSGAWTWNLNPNGSPGRPDGRTNAAILHQDDLVDLRHDVGMSEPDLDARLKSDVSKLLTGQLRTRMANKWAGFAGAGGAVAGSRILQTDCIGGTGGVAFDLTPPGNDRRIWSDAKEFHVVARAFDMSVNYVDALVNYNAAGGTLTINSPPATHLVRHIPAIALTDDNGAFLGPPCWSTRRDPAAQYPTPADSRRVLANVDTAIAYSAPGFSYTVAVDDSFSHPTSMATTLINSNTGTATLSWWVHYNRTYVALDGYNVNYGLAEIPDVVHSVIKGPFTGTPRTSNLGAIYASVKKAVAGNSFTITAADVQASTSIPGAVFTLVGVDANYMIPSSSPFPGITSITMDAARTTITITLAAVYNGFFNVLTFFKTDLVDTWVEVGRGGKSVRAYFEWNEYNDPALVPAATYAFSIGSDIWHPIEVATRQVKAPFVYTRTAPGDWTMSLVHVAGQAFSNLVSLSSLAIPGAHDDILVISPVHVAPTAVAADEFLLHYTYTPYQGLSSSGGASATVPAATTKLVEMLHGTVEADSGFYATQSGACSLFGGVDAWSGNPYRFAGGVTYHAPWFQYTGLDATDLYPFNATHLVKSDTSFRLHDLIYSPTTGLTAAAAMRLPVPGNPAMIYALTGNVHPLIADFDLDPGRNGAGAGPFVYAPSYAVTENHLMAPTTVMGYSVNGLSKFSQLYGDAEQNESNWTASSEYFLYDLSSSSPSVDYSNTYWTVDPSSIFSTRIAVHSKSSSCVSAALIRIDNVDPADFFFEAPIPINPNADSWVTLIPGSGTLLAPGPMQYFNDNEGLNRGYTTWTRPFVAIADAQLFFNIGPALSYYRAASLSGQPIGSMLSLYLDTSAAVGTRQVHSTRVVIDSNMLPTPVGVAGVLWAGEPPRFRPTIDTMHLGAGSGSGPAFSGKSDGRLSLVGSSIGYPGAWTAPTKTLLESAVAPSVLFRAGYGRGLYLGDTTTMYSMPVMVPGSGTALSEVYTTMGLGALVQPLQAPVSYGTVPQCSLFEPSNKVYSKFDHGGKLAYVFRSMVINPVANTYKNVCVLHISGGMLSPVHDTSTEGTAIDAFWPTGRPILPPR